MFTLSLGNYLQTKTIATEDGVKLKVRQLGAGETLDISQIGRKATKLIEESQKLKAKIGDKVDPNSEEFKAILDLSDKVGKLNERIEELYLNAFDDGTEDKHIARQIIHTLGAQKMPELMKDIFDNA